MKQQTENIFMDETQVFEQLSVFAKAVWYAKNGGKFHVIFAKLGALRWSIKRIRRSKSKTYWTLNSYKLTVPKPIWFKILSAQFWENVIWKWLKTGESAKDTRDGNLHARQRHKNNPESFITWIQLDRISNNLNKWKMHRKLARGRRNNLQQVTPNWLGNLMQIGQKQGGGGRGAVVNVTWRKASRIRKGIFFNHIRKVNCGRNLKRNRPTSTRGPCPVFSDNDA